MPVTEGRERGSTPPPHLDSPSAFEKLYRDCYPSLVRTCRSWGLDGAAEDIAQETLARAHAHIRELDLRRPWGWLRTTAYNLMVDRKRKEARAVVVDRQNVPEASEDFPDIEELAVVSNTLSALPERYRHVLREYYLRDRDPQEISARMNISRSAFKQLVHRARQRFRAEYLRQGGEKGRGLLAIPTLWLARRGEALVDRFRRATGTTGAEHLSSVALQQLATALVALAMVLSGSLPAPASEEPSPRREAITDEGELPRRRPAADSGDGSAAPAAQPPADDTLGREPAGDEGGPKKLLDDITKPNHDVQDPEDSRIVSIAHSPRFSQDGTVFSLGVTDCRATLCPSVLFRSTDGGSTWDRLKGEGLYGVNLMLPPAYATGDNRLFVMGPGGLQVSDDGGEAFGPAAVAGATQATGSAAISPAFNEDDPSILIGAQTLMRYRDDLKTIEAAPSSAMPGPLEPAFSPTYREDGTVLIGGVRFDPTLGETAATVYTCREAVCSWTTVSSDDQSPKIRVTPQYGIRGLVHVFTHWGIYVSRDRGSTFEPLRTPWAMDAVLKDLAVTSDGQRLFAALRTAKGHSDDGLYVSHDGGGRWKRLTAHLFHKGVEDVTTMGHHVMAGLAEGGVACSSDGGRTWAARCS